MTVHLDLELSLLLDGELEGAALVAAESHLLECADCRAAYEALRGVKRAAQALDDRPPARDLWDGIARRIHETPRDVVPITAAPSRRRFAFSVPQLAAAAIALMAVSAGAATLLVNRHAPLPAGTAALSWPVAGTVTPVSLAKTPGGMGVATYDAAIRDIEETLRSRRVILDTATVRVVEQSLRIIDDAVRQAREALARDPNNLYLNTHLQNALGRKLDLLRHVATLPTVS